MADLVDVEGRTGFRERNHLGGYRTRHFLIASARISDTMKFLLVAALFAVSQAAVLYHHPWVYGHGTSAQYRTQDIAGNYHFGYNEGHATGGTFRRESGDIAGNKVGSYGLSDADGRRRVVNYVADGAGFRATVDTNEPGVDPSKDPASVAVNKGAVLAHPYYGHHGLYGLYGHGLYGHHYYF